MRKFIAILLILSTYTLGAQTVFTLEDCRRLALDNSYSAKEAKLNLRAAQYQRKEAFTEFFPRLSLNSISFYSFNPIINIELSDVLENQALDAAYLFSFETGMKTNWALPKHGYTASALIVQPLFAGFRIVNGNKLAELGVKAAELQQRTQERKTFEEIDNYYWQTVSLQDKIKTIGSFKDLLDTLYRDVSVALEQGLITEDQFLQVQIKRNELRATELKLRNGIKLSKINLLNYIDYKYEFLKLDSISFSLDDCELKSPDYYYEDETKVVGNLEELALLDLQIKAKKLQKNMELGAVLPQVLVGATYGYSGLGEHNKWNTLVFTSLSIPISDWWKNSLKQRRLQTEVDKARAQREYLGEQLLLLVRKTWVELCGAWDEYQLATDSYGAANQSFARQKAQYEAGMITISELLQSQAHLQQTLSSLIDARISYQKSLGRWLDMSKATI